MELLIEEMTNSWTHCKELIKSGASIQLVVAFLEDFKIQFTSFYNRMKQIQKTKYQELAFGLVDTFFLFKTNKGELSHLITYVKNNWHAKKQLLKKIDVIDKTIFSILSQYTSSNKSYL